MGSVLRSWSAALDLFKVLVRRSYGPSYTRDADRAVPSEELVSLLLMADSYEFTTCVEACAQALMGDLTFEQAASLFTAIPETLQSQGVLKELMERAGEVVAKGLGKVEDQWTHIWIARFVKPKEKGARQRPDFDPYWRFEGAAKVRRAYYDGKGV